MSINALKAQWVVTASVIPGEPDRSLTRVWHYTGFDHLADLEYQRTHGETAGMAGTRFAKMRAEARDYAESLQEPSMQNWVKLDWMWM